MILQVNDKWRIVSDTNQWTVQEYVVPQKADAKTEPFWRSRNYFTGPDRAALWLAGQRVRDLPGTYPAADALEVLGKALDEIVRETKRAMEGVK